MKKADKIARSHEFIAYLKANGFKAASWGALEAEYRAVFWPLHVEPLPHLSRPSFDQLKEFLFSPPNPLLHLQSNGLYALTREGSEETYPQVKSLRPFPQADSFNYKERQSNEALSYEIECYFRKLRTSLELELETILQPSVELLCSQFVRELRFSRVNYLLEELLQLRTYEDKTAFVLSFLETFYVTVDPESKDMLIGLRKNKWNGSGKTLLDHLNHLYRVDIKCLREMPKDKPVLIGKVILDLQKHYSSELTFSAVKQFALENGFIVLSRWIISKRSQLGFIRGVLNNLENFSNFELELRLLRCNNLALRKPNTVYGNMTTADLNLTVLDNNSTPDEIGSVFRQLGQEDVLFIDTECSDVKGRVLALIQIATEDESVFLFHVQDNFENQFTEMKDLMESRDILKVLHGCRGDSELLWKRLKITLSNVFDTQSALWYLEAKHDMIARVDTNLKINLPSSGLTRPSLNRSCDVMETPLNLFKEEFKKLFKIGNLTWCSDKEILYASLDVIVLIHLYHALMGRLEPEEYQTIVRDFGSEQIWSNIDPMIAYNSMIKTIQDQIEKKGVENVILYQGSRWPTCNARPLDENTSENEYKTLWSTAVHAERAFACKEMERYKLNNVHWELSYSDREICFAAPRLCEKVPPLRKEDTCEISFRSGGKWFKSNCDVTNVDYSRLIVNVKLKDNVVFAQMVLVRSVLVNVAFNPNVATFSTMLDSIDGLSKRVFGDWLFPVKKPSNLILFNRDIYNNPGQFSAVRYILAKRFAPHPYLIFGPPGTGKTRVLIEVIVQVALRLDEKVLVCAQSNQTCDMLTSALLQYFTGNDKGKVVRILAEYLNVVDIPDREVRSVSVIGEISDKTDPDIEQFKDKRVFVMTCSKAASFGKVLSKLNIKFLCVDEAAAVVEPLLLGAAASCITPETGYLILAGDHRQRGPVVKNHKVSTVLGTSYFARLMHCDLYKPQNGTYDPTVITKLLINYRSS